jgi:hypothetical protein
MASPARLYKSVECERVSPVEARKATTDSFTANSSNFAALSAFGLALDWDDRATVAPRKAVQDWRENTYGVRGLLARDNMPPIRVVNHPGFRAHLLLREG